MNVEDEIRYIKATRVTGVTFTLFGMFVSFAIFVIYMNSERDDQRLKDLEKAVHILALPKDQ